MAYCRNCGNQIDDQAAFCSRCGYAVNMTNYNSPLTNNSFSNPPVSNSYATASLVLGILGVIFCSVPLLGSALNIIGLVLAVKSRKVSYCGKGTAGLVLTIIGLSLSSIALIGHFR